jgi:Phosphatidylinositol 3- and 4-kinase
MHVHTAVHYTNFYRKQDGLVEFVADSLPVSQVLSSYSNSILEFLKYHNPDALGPLGVSAAALSTFVKSTAGYCVITYILGIGDRLVYITCVTCNTYSSSVCIVCSNLHLCKCMYELCARMRECVACTPVSMI